MPAKLTMATAVPLHTWLLQAPVILLKRKEPLQRKEVIQVPAIGPLWWQFCFAAWKWNAQKGVFFSHHITKSDVVAPYSSLLAALHSLDLSLQEFYSWIGMKGTSKCSRAIHSKVITPFYMLKSSIYPVKKNNTWLQAFLLLKLNIAVLFWSQATQELLGQEFGFTWKRRDWRQDSRFQLLIQHNITADSADCCQQGSAIFYTEMVPLTSMSIASREPRIAMVPKPFRGPRGAARFINA